MSLDRHKLEYLDKSHQFVLIDDRACIKESCNSLVDLSGYYSKPVFEIVPFLETARQEIADLENGDKIEYQCINMPLLEHRGIFDFTLSRNNHETILVIEDRREYYEQLQKLQQERNQSIIKKEIREKEARMKSTFLANMSHEIRTPMNIVIGYTDLLLSSNDLKLENREFANNISIAAGNLLVLINDILDLSKIEAGYLNIEIVPVDLKRLMSNLRSMFQNQCRDSNIDFQINYGEIVPAVIKSDPVRINQILTNLVSNALKFTDDGGKVFIDVRVEPKGGKLAFEVADSGIGIESGKLEKIFESFTQEEESTTRIFGGTGLGLSIVKKLTGLLDGSVSVRSKKGEGSTFTVKIPLVEGDLSELEEEHEKAGDYDRNEIAGKQLLIAEDNKMNRMLIVKILEDTGAILTLAENGMEVVKQAESRKFDAILMDIQMPVMDGVEATKKIRADSVLNQDTPIIAMTAHSLEEDMNRCYDAGMAGYISKPFQMDSLFSVIIEQIRSADEAASAEVGIHPAMGTEILDDGDVKLDFQFLNDLADGNREFIQEFLETYIEEMTMALDDMADQVQNENLADFKDVVHKIKPTLEMVGLLEFKKRIEVFEQNDITLERAGQLLQELKPTLEGSVNVVSKMLDEPGSVS